ncbi:MAG TPA: sugar kinase [Thermomicrobiales bacterium]|nr:sugar kinase [Thermomicrobiales bacterium]
MAGTDGSAAGQESITAGRFAGHVVTLGEAMLRYTPPRNERLERTLSLDISGGGAELNTAIGTACLGLPSTFISVVPDNGLGRWLVRSARAHGVDVAGIEVQPESLGRLGVYYLEEGVDPRPSAVTYDRADSAMARIEPGRFDWPAILQGAAVFHVSGITPALGAGCRAETLEAVRTAKELGVPVAFDLNYRSKLWSEAEAAECFLQLVPGVDILFAGKGALRTFFHIDGQTEDVLRRTRAELGVGVIALPRKRNIGSRGIRLSSWALGEGEIARAPWVETEIVDRLGGGDAFAAGFLAGLLETRPAPDAPIGSADLNRACALGTAASALKHTIPGDFLCATRAEIEAVAAGVEAGTLQR